MKSDLSKLDSCHPDLIAIVSAVAIHFSLRVTCGRRGEVDQNRLYDSGLSLVRYPDSKHNETPSLAVDIVPLPVNWEDITAFTVLAGAMFYEARRRGIELVWGGYFKNLKDYGHYELGASSQGKK